MPTYYFNLTAEQSESLDVMSLPDLTAARGHALTKALELLWESPYRLHAEPEWVVMVKDAEGKALLSVTLFEALGHDFGAQAVN